MTVRVVVVDDEELARRGIRTRLQRYPEAEIVAECGNGRKAIDAIRRVNPDLVFLDVQMPGQSGFDVIREVGPGAFRYVIFATAYDHYAIRAFDVNALDYLLKPIDDERFDQAFARAREALAEDRDRDLGRRLASVLSDVKPANSGARPVERIVVKSAGRVMFVKVSEIDWVEAAGDYVTLHAGKRSLLLRETITEMQSKLEASRFTRIHRSVIVNSERVVEMKALDNGEYRVLLRDGTGLKLSRSYRHALPQLMSDRL